MGTINYVQSTLHDCNSTSGWSSGGSLSTLEGSEKPPKYGSGCLDLKCNTGTSTMSCTFGAIDATEFDFTFWFYPLKGKTQYLSNNADTVAFRLYNGSNYCQFNFGGESSVPPGWNCFLISGTNYDSSSAGWTDSMLTAITKFEFLLNNQSSNTSNAGTHSVDWLKIGKKITVIGNNAGSPYTFQDLINANDSNNWGIAVKAGASVTLRSGLQIGDGLTTTEFTTAGEYVYFDQFSPEVEYDFTIKTSSLCAFGTKVLGPNTGDTYATNGCTIHLREDRPANFIIEDGASVGLYSTKLVGWENVNLGVTRSDPATLEIISCEVFDCVGISLHRDTVSITGLEVHHMRNEGDARAVSCRCVPALIKGLHVHDSINGIFLMYDGIIYELLLENNTMDIQVLDAVDLSLVNLVNAVFDTGKLEVVLS